MLQTRGGFQNWVYSFSFVKHWFLVLTIEFIVQRSMTHFTSPHRYYYSTWSTRWFYLVMPTKRFLNSLENYDIYRFERNLTSPNCIWVHDLMKKLHLASIYCIRIKIFYTKSKKCIDKNHYWLVIGIVYRALLLVFVKCRVSGIEVQVSYGFCSGSVAFSNICQHFSASSGTFEISKNPTTLSMSLCKTKALLCCVCPAIEKNHQVPTRFLWRSSFIVGAERGVRLNIGACCFILI